MVINSFIVGVVVNVDDGLVVLNVFNPVKLLLLLWTADSVVAPDAPYKLSASRFVINSFDDGVIVSVEVGLDILNALVPVQLLFVVFTTYKVSASPLLINEFVVSVPPLVIVGLFLKLVVPLTKLIVPFKVNEPLKSVAQLGFPMYILLLATTWEVPIFKVFASKYIIPSAVVLLIFKKVLLISIEPLIVSLPIVIVPVVEAVPISIFVNASIIQSFDKVATKSPPSNKISSWENMLLICAWISLLIFVR